MTDLEGARRRARRATTVTVAVGVITLTAFGLELKESRDQSADLRRALRAEQENTERIENVLKETEASRISGRRALCLQIENLKAVQRAAEMRRKNQTVAFLRENPRGTEAIPAAALRQSLSNMDKTIRSLAPIGKDGQTVAEACDDFAHGRA